MTGDDDLIPLLPSRRAGDLAAAIGRRLADVAREFALDLPAFLAVPGAREEDFFARNGGPVQLEFDGGPVHTLGVWGEQLSVVLLPERLRADDYGSLHRLSETASAPAGLRACLGRVCEDVRVWTFRDDFPAEEAREAGVSYVFAGGAELLYAVYFHGELDNDYLLLDPVIPPERVERCFSLARGAAVDPRPGGGAP